MQNLTASLISCAAIILCVLAVSLTIFRPVEADSTNNQDSNIRRYGGIATQSSDNFIGVEPYYPYSEHGTPEQNNMENDMAVSRRKRFFSIMSPADRLRNYYVQVAKGRVSTGKVIPRSGIFPFAMRQ